MVITRRGKGVARLRPVSPLRRLSGEQLAAWKRTLARMRRGYSLGGKMPPRDELHQR